MHKKCSWKLIKIPCNVEPIETNSPQRFRSLREVLVYVSNKPINIRYFERVYRWKISIFNLKMEFWFQ